MNKKLLGAIVGAVFAFAMMSNPVFAVSANLQIESTDGFSMTVKGGHPGGPQENHDIVVYAFFTETDGVTPNSFVAYVVAGHAGFADDPEQDPKVKTLHAHKLELNKETLCVQDITEAPDADVDKSTVSIPDAAGSIFAYVIAGYDIDDGSICPTEVYDAQLVA